MMNNSLEKALKETWKNKEKFYEDTKHLSIMEIIEKIEGKKFGIKESEEKMLSGKRIK
ncbi:MAG: hypothetical protein FWF73_07440 [Spirochaetes bacterium]|nr:hypothetical protein [Spirochaetota bacterium]